MRRASRFRGSIRAARKELLARRHCIGNDRAMALIVCPECGQEICHQAVICPWCGVTRGVWTDWRGFQLLSIPLIVVGAIAVFWVRLGFDDGTLADMAMIAGYVGAYLLVAAPIGRLWYQSTPQGRGYDVSSEPHR